MGSFVNDTTFKTFFINDPVSQLEKPKTLCKHHQSASNLRHLKKKPSKLMNKKKA